MSEAPKTPSPETRGWVDGFLRGPAVALLAVLLFGMVNYAASRHYRRFDLTRSGSFTLSPRSIEIARGLRAKTDVYVLLSRSEPIYGEVRELIERYASASARLELHFIDPDRQRDRFLALAQQLDLPIVESAEAGRSMSTAGIVVQSRNRHWQVDRESLRELSTNDEGEGGNAARITNARITVERAISEALLQVDRERATKVCFSTGHNELGIATNEQGARGGQGLADALRHQNFTIETVEVRGQTGVPQTCDVLFIAGTARAWSTEDAAAVERYLRAGGNLAAFVDALPLEGRIAPTGLEGIARAVGIALPPALVIEQESSHIQPETPPLQFRADTWSEHEITRALRGTSLVVSMLRPLTRAEGSTVVPTVLVSTTPDGWGETEVADLMRTLSPSRDTRDLAGPVALAMASEYPNATRRGEGVASGRVVFFGTSSILEGTNFTLQARAVVSNASMVEAVVGWLSSRRELIEVPARPAERISFLVSDSEVMRVGLYVMVLVPLAAALVGIAVWRARKNSP